MRRVLYDVSKVDLTSTLKAITANKYDCEIENSSDKSLWSPTDCNGGQPLAVASGLAYPFYLGVEFSLVRERQKSIKV